MAELVRMLGRVAGRGAWLVLVAVAAIAGYGTGAESRAMEVYLACREDGYYVVRENSDDEHGRGILCRGLTAPELAKEQEEDEQPELYPAFPARV